MAPAALALLACLGACTRDVGLLALTDGGMPQDRPPGMDQRPDAPGGTGGSGGAGGASGACAPLRFPDASGTCAGTLAARTSRFALCSCANWSVTAPVYTDTFSWSSAMASPLLAAVGVNGNILATGGLSIRGSVYASGTGGISTSAQLDVGKTLRSAGPVVVMPPAMASVSGDAYVGGNISGPAMISGTLHLPAYAMVGAAVNAMTTVREDVSVPAPCDCTMAFDVAGVIAARATTNDDASIGLDPNRLIMPGGPTSIDIPCGSFYLAGINALSPVNLSVHGRAMIAIAGDVVLGGGMTVMLDPGAELDLLIGGALTSYGNFPVGDYIAAPLRIWMASAAPITLNGRPVIGGLFQAPLSTVSAPAGMEIYGSILAASFNLGDQVVLHYDQSAVAGGAPCGDPPVDTVP